MRNQNNIGIFVDNPQFSQTADNFFFFFFFFSHFCPLSCVYSTERNSSNSMIPSYFAFREFSVEMLPAVPPTWNVRKVSCVPGSLIDCAAMVLRQLHPSVPAYR